MKNTVKNNKIKEKRSLKKKKILGGITMFSLLSTLTFSSFIPKKDNKDLGEEMYGYYSTSYIDTLRSVDEEDFDKEFLKQYGKEKYTFGDKEFEAKSIYIVKNNDDTVFLINVPDNFSDILTGKKMEYDRKSISRFRDSTIFYDLYENNLLNPCMKFDSSELSSYIQKWDGEKHDKTPQLYADKKAKEAFRKKYGR